MRSTVFCVDLVLQFGESVKNRLLELNKSQYYINAKQNIHFFRLRGGNRCKRWHTRFADVIVNSIETGERTIVEQSDAHTSGETVVSSRWGGPVWPPKTDDMHGRPFYCLGVLNSSYFGLRTVNRQRDKAKTKGYALYIIYLHGLALSFYFRRATPICLHTRRPWIVPDYVYAMWV